MAQVIRIKRHIGNAQPPTSAQVTAGELAYNRGSAPGVTAGPDDLYVGDGAAAHLLVGAARQVEVTGNQNVAGLKTFATLPSFPGGTAGNVLTTNGAGVLSWAATPPATVQVTPPITGDGATGSELSLTVATVPQIVAGTDNVFPISSLGMRNQMGAAATAANLGTTAATVVPAIKELADKLAGIAGPLQQVGIYSAVTNTITAVSPPALPPLVGQPLPAASAANKGWFFIVSGANGTGTPPAPPVTLAAGDWVLSDGTAWLHIDINIQTFAASNVSFVPIPPTPGPGIPATNVQAAIAAVYTEVQNTIVVADLVSIIGTGAVGDELEVALVDAGTYT